MKGRMSILKKCLIEFLKAKTIKTIWFNFKMFPFKTAIRMPIYLYGKTTFRSLNGKIFINAAINPGMIKIGKSDWYVDTSLHQCIWTINGSLIFNGPVTFGHGSYVVISNNATLTIGTNGTFFGSNLKIICFDKISIGNNVRVTWDCQFMDTSFHYIKNLESGEIPPLTKPIIVGDRVWIANRTTISKGAIIPSDTIISSNSLVNKDYSMIGPYTMLAGIPAIPKLAGRKRVFDDCQQAALDAEYGYSRTHL